MSDPTITRNDDGTVTIRWPDPPRRTYEVAHEALQLMVDDYNAEVVERERLRDGIRDFIQTEVFEVDELRTAKWDDDFVTLALLVDDRERRCECGHTLQPEGPGGPYRCVAGCTYQADRDRRQVDAGPDRGNPMGGYRTLDGSEGGEDV